MTLDDFFAGRAEARDVFDAVRAQIDEFGPTELRISKSQVAFVREHNVAVVWTPDRYLKSTVPLVLTVSLLRHDPSPRWKEVVQVSSGRYTHHLELRSTGEVDDEVRSWLAEAWALAEVAR